MPKKKKKPAKKSTPPTEKKLTTKQRRFVEEMLVDVNQTQAAIRAGYSPKTARDIGCELMATPHIALAVSKAMHARSERTQITADFVLTELRKIAGSDMTRIGKWGPDGFDPSYSEDLEEADSACIEEVSSTSTEFGTSIKVKLHSKIRALELLGKHLGLFVKDEGGGEDGAAELSPPLTDAEITNSIAIAKGLKK